MNRRDAKRLARIVTCFLIESQQGVGWDTTDDWSEADAARFEDALDELAQELYNSGGVRGAQLYSDLFVAERSPDPSSRRHPGTTLPVDARALAGLY